LTVQLVWLVNSLPSLSDDGLLDYRQKFHPEPYVRGYLGWDTWLSDEFESGRWAEPHTGSFCPQPSTFGIKPKPLPNYAPLGFFARFFSLKADDPGRELVKKTMDFAWICMKHGAHIKRMFDLREDGVRVTNAYANGTPCRSELTDTGFLKETERELGLLFDATPFEKNSRIVYRLSNPDGLPEPSNNWISEQWHFDNFFDDGFKLLLYCSRVDDDNAPFEYQEPPTFVPTILKNTSGVDTHLRLAGWNITGMRKYLKLRMASRLNYVGSSTRVTGPAGTGILFKNSNLPHKGNYCRKGIRDVISFHFVSNRKEGKGKKKKKRDQNPQQN